MDDELLLRESSSRIWCRIMASGRILLSSQSLKTYDSEEMEITNHEPNSAYNPPPPLSSLSPPPPFLSILKRHTKMESEDNNHLRAIKLVHLPSDTACDFPEQNSQEVQQLITNVGELLGLLKDICHQNHLKFFRSRFNSQYKPQTSGDTDFLLLCQTSSPIKTQRTLAERPHQ